MTFKQKRSGVAALAGVTLLSGGLAIAQNGGGQMQQQQQQQQTNAANSNANNSNPGAPNSNALQDNDFVHEALEGGLVEVQLGKLASEKGSGDDVKQFGAQMVADHTKMNDVMGQVATQMGVKQPKDLSKKDQKMVDKMQGLSGADFDKAYIIAMVKDHKKDDQDFKTEGGQTQNTQLKQVVDQGTQVIEHHLQMIEQIAKGHNLIDDKGKLASN